MATYKRALRIVVASPDDVQAERNLLEDIIKELNQGIADEHGLVLELSRWETDAYPSFHPEGRQQAIDSALDIENCDLLIGIFWKRFSNSASDLQSGTEHEFRTVYEAWRRNHRPQIMMYFNEKSYAPKSTEEIDQWRQVLEFKRNFPKEGLWWSYKRVTQFEKFVRNHLAQFIRENIPTTKPSPSAPKDTTITETIASATPTSRNIIALPPPTDPKTIQQREKAVEQVYTLLTQPDTTAVVLTGIGGVGKSTLAALVYQHAQKQRLANKGPFTAEPLWLKIDLIADVTLTDIAGTILTALGKPTQDITNLLPQQLAIALFNALNTTDKARLIVLDQFENLLDWRTGHALPNRPGIGEWIDALNSQPLAQSGCRVLLTSRPWPIGTREPSPIHMKEYYFERLETAEGMELLKKRGIEAAEKDLQTAVERCDAHAFALTLLASLLFSRKLSLATFFKDPANMHLWTGNVARNLLDYIYTQQLDQVQRKLLLAFSIYREPVPVEAALALLDLSPELSRTQVQDALDVLLTQHLLQATGEGRYQLHAIVIDYAHNHFVENDEQANSETRRATHTKAAQYYLQVATTSCPPREKRRRVNDVQPLIEAIWHYCQTGQWQEAYDLMQKESIFDDMNRWGGNVILLELYQSLLDQWQPERSLEAGIYHQLGRVYIELGKSKEALTYFEEALRIWREVGDRQGEGATLGGLGRLYNRLGKQEEARKCHEEALRLHREVGDRISEGMTLNNLGGVYDNSGQKEKALTYYQDALAIWREIGDRRGEGATLNNLGGVYNSLGQKEKALSYYQEALVIGREVGDRAGEGTTLNNLGLLYNSLGQKEEALSYFQEALTISREVGDRAAQGAMLNNLGGVYDSLGQKEKVLTYYKQALAIRREVGDRAGEAITLWNIGALYFQQNRHDVALACFLLAKRIFEEVMSPYRDSVQNWINDLREEVGDQQYVSLLANVEPQAPQIIEQALREGL